MELVLLELRKQRYQDFLVDVFISKFSVEDKETAKEGENQVNGDSSSRAEKTKRRNRNRGRRNKKEKNNNAPSQHKVDKSLLEKVNVQVCVSPCT